MTASSEPVKALTAEVAAITRRVKQITAAIKAGTETEAQIQELAELRRAFTVACRKLMEAMGTMMRDVRKRKLS